jgi:hypothetical protein
MEHGVQNNCQEKSVLTMLPGVTLLLNLQEVSLFEQSFGIHEGHSEIFLSRFVNCD